MNPKFKVGDIVQITKESGLADGQSYTIIEVAEDRYYVDYTTGNNIYIRFNDQNKIELSTLGKKKKEFKADMEKLLNEDN